MAGSGTDAPGVKRGVDFRIRFVDGKTVEEAAEGFPRGLVGHKQGPDRKEGHACLEVGAG